MRGWALAGSRSRRSALLFASSLLLAVAPVVARPPIHASAAAVPTPTPPQPEIATYAGTPIGGDPLAVAQQPFGVAASGRFTYVADPTNHVVRILVDNVHASELPFAGNGGVSVEGDGNDPSQAQLAGPYAVAAGRISQVGQQITGFDVYIADTFGHKVRRVSITIPLADAPVGTNTATITTVAGDGSFGFSGDGGAATAAQLNSPYGVAWDGVSNTVYIADTLNDRIRAVGPDGLISTVVGAGAPAKPLQIALNRPRGLAIDGAGRLYIADTGNDVVRLYDPGPFDSQTGFRHGAGTLTTVAGDGTAGFMDAAPAVKGRFRQPTSLALDAAGNLYIADTGNNVVREVSRDGRLQTIAGTGTAGYGGDDGPATGAQLSAPFGVAVRGDGDLVVADTGNNDLRVVDALPAADGTRHIHRVAGNGTASFAGDGRKPADAQFAGPSSILSYLAAGPPATGSPAPQTEGARFVVDTFNDAVRGFTTFSKVSTFLGQGGVPGSLDTGHAQLNEPMSAALNASGTALYVADTFNNRVLRLDLNTNRVTTVASGLSYPMGVAVDVQNNLYIADTYDDVIKRVDPSGATAVVAGTGQLGYAGDGGAATSADLYFPAGISVSQSTPPTLYIADSFNHRVRVVTPDQKISTLAGNGTPGLQDGVAASSAELNRPWATALNSSGLFIADFLNHRVRLVDTSTNTIGTVAGVGTSGLLGDLGRATQAEVDGPRAVSPIGDSGAVLVADSFNDRVRWVGVTQAGVYRSQVNFQPQNLDSKSQAQTVTLSSVGSGLLVVGSIGLDPTSDFQVDPSADSCSKERLEPGVSCTFAVAFQPLKPGQRNTTLAIPDDAAPNPQAVQLSGEATAPVATFGSTSVVLHQKQGGIADPAVLTLRNTGDGALVINSITVDGSGFAQSNDCPPSLLPQAFCSITISMDQIPTGSRNGLLTLLDNVPGGAQHIPILGAVIAPTVSLSPAGVSFSQNVGGSSPPTMVQLVNTGAGPLTISAMKAKGNPDFGLSSNCPTVVAPQASCMIAVTFTPSGTGQEDATIALADDASDSPQSVPLVGFGTMPSATFQPHQMNFAENLPDGTRSQRLTLRNAGDGPLTIGSVGISGPFQQTNNCPRQVAPQESCVITVSFAPSATGTFTGALMITDDADSVAGSQQRVGLTGVAVAPAVALFPTVVAPDVNVGGAPTYVTVSLRNSGDGNLTMFAVRLADGSGDYNLAANSCVGVILPQDTCAVTIGFMPHQAGQRPASLVFTDNARGSPQVVELRGVGTGPVATLSAGTVTLGPAAIGTTTTPQVVTLTNTGTGPLTLTGTVLDRSTPDWRDFAYGTNCPIVLAAHASCTLSITFTPTAPGRMEHSALLVSDNSVNGPQQVISLSGQGS